MAKRRISKKARATDRKNGRKAKGRVVKIHSTKKAGRKSSLKIHGGFKAMEHKREHKR